MYMSLVLGPMCAKEISVVAAPAVLSALNGISTSEEEQTEGRRTAEGRSHFSEKGLFL